MEKKRRGCGEATWVTLCCHGTSSSTENQLPTAPLTYLQVPSYLPVTFGLSSGLRDGRPMCRDTSLREKSGRTWGGRTPTTTCGIWSPSVGDRPPFPRNTPNQYYLCSTGAEKWNQEPLP